VASGLPVALTDCNLFYFCYLRAVAQIRASPPNAVVVGNKIERFRRHYGFYGLNRHLKPEIFRLVIESRMFGSCGDPRARSTIMFSAGAHECGSGPRREFESRMTSARHAFGMEALDRELGGGLLPGTLTVLAGATGVGKTQLGLQWANAGLSAEGKRGVLCDLTSRGDSQNHGAYSSRLFGWELSEYPLTPKPDFEHVWDFTRAIGDYFHPFDRVGRRVTRSDLEADVWHEWKSDLSRILRCSAGFFYQQFARGTRRVVFDGLEPVMLDELMTQPIAQGDIFANANTIILMGRTRNDGRYGRALAIPKHRGSACGDEILTYRITDGGIVFG
jgi:hypothetical protein